MPEKHLETKPLCPGKLLSIDPNGFSKGIHRIYAECDPDNAPSWRLLESLGFRKEAHYRKNVYFWKDHNGNPVWKDTFVYALLNDHS